MPRVSQVSQYGRPEYSAVRCLLFGANLTDVGILRYVCLLFPDGKNILARITPTNRNEIRVSSKPEGIIENTALLLAEQQLASPSCVV